jgi:hypothetical protein
MFRADDNRCESHELLGEPLLRTAEVGAPLSTPRSAVYDYAKRRSTWRPAVRGWSAWSIS